MYSLSYAKHLVEQMDKISDNLAETNDSLARSERILRGMKSVGATFMNAFRSKPEEKADVIKEQRKMKGQELKSKVDARRYQEDEKTAQRTSIENEEDAQLDLLGSHLKNIRMMAEDIGDELDHQDQLLDTIDTQIDHADDRLKTNNRMMRKLIGK